MTQPKDNLSLSGTSTSQNTRPLPPLHMHPQRRDTYYSKPISRLQDGCIPQRKRLSSRSKHIHSRPVQHLRVIYRTSCCIPKVTLFPRLENFNVAMKRGRRTSLPIPTTIVFSCPLKYIQPPREVQSQPGRRETRSRHCRQSDRQCEIKVSPLREFRFCLDPTAQRWRVR